MDIYIPSLNDQTSPLTIAMNDISYQGQTSYGTLKSVVESGPLPLLGVDILLVFPWHNAFSDYDILYIFASSLDYVPRTLPSMQEAWLWVTKSKTPFPISLHAYHELLYHIKQSYMVNLTSDASSAFSYFLVIHINFSSHQWSRCYTVSRFNSKWHKSLFFGLR